MLARRIGWSVAIALAVTGSSWAQLPIGPPGAAAAPGEPVEMTIFADKVEIRSGPTLKHYATGELHKGERVLVRRDWREQPGWLQINPPPGSFSWIRASCVTVANERTGIVNKDTAIIPGSSLVSQKSDVETVTVKPGTQVEILSKPTVMDNESWLQITPPPTDVRYIPAAAVQPAPEAVNVSSSGFPTQRGGGAGSLLDQANQAMSNGNLALARQLYQQVYQTGDAQQKIFALNRLTTMSAPALASTTPAGSSTWQPAAPGQQNLMKNTARTTTHYAIAGTTMTNIQPPQWSKWGYLRRASFDKDGQPVYVLEPPQSRDPASAGRDRPAPLYAVTEAGHSQTLANLTGRFVCLYGPITYRSDDTPRVQFMVVSHFAVP